VCAFRLLTMDLLVLYGVMNEGTINVLGRRSLISKLKRMTDIMPRALLRNVTVRRGKGSQHI